MAEPTGASAIPSGTVVDYLGRAMLRDVRRRVLSALKSAGILRIVANSRWRQNRLLILCYHGISIADEHLWNGQLYMSPEALRGRFEILRRGAYNVLPLGDAVRRLAAGTLPPRSVSLTFDDGAYDFYARAFPLLREFRYPATVYMTTYYSEHQWPVFDTGVAYMLWRGRRAGTVDLSNLVPGLASVSLDKDAARRAAALGIRSYANHAGLSGEEKDRLLRRLAARLAVHYEQVFSRRLLFLMTPAEAREVAAAGIDVQLHTHRHRTPDDRAAFTREIDDNRSKLESLVGPGERVHFCYPSGVYNPQFFEWLSASGVETATTCDNALATPADNRLLLPRLVDTMNIGPIEFEAWLTGLADLLPHTRAAHAELKAAAAQNRAVGDVRSAA